MDNKLNLNPNVCFTSYTDNETLDEDPPVPAKIAKRIIFKGYKSVREYLMKETDIFYVK